MDHQEGTSGEDVFAAIVAVEDGASVVLAGTSGVRGFSTSSSSSEEGRFFAAVKLDAASGSVLWRWGVRELRITPRTRVESMPR